MVDTHSSAADWTKGQNITCTIGGTAPGCVREIGDITLTASKIDVTCHNATNSVKKYISGMVEVGDITITIRYDKTAVSGFQALMTGAFQDAQSVVLSYNFETPETCTFDAIITGVSVTHASDDAVTAKITLSPVSAPVWA